MLDVRSLCFLAACLPHAFATNAPTMYPTSAGDCGWDAAYEVRTSGVCEKYIETECECEKAAVNTVLEGILSTDTSCSSQNSWYVPHGCYFKGNTKYSSLYFNEYEYDEKVDMQCSADEPCVCKISPTTPYPTPLPRRNFTQSNTSVFECSFEADSCEGLFRNSDRMSWTRHHGKRYL